METLLFGKDDANPINQYHLSLLVVNDGPPSNTTTSTSIICSNINSGCNDSKIFSTATVL